MTTTITSVRLPTDLRDRAKRVYPAERVSTLVRLALTRILDEEELRIAEQERQLRIANTGPKAA